MQEKANGINSMNTHKHLASLLAMLLIFTLFALPLDAPAHATFSEDFQPYVVGADPYDWFDTARNNSMGHEEGMFKVLDVGGQKAFGTKQTKTTNIHSHYVGGNSANWTNYEYSGRMRISGARDGIGVTFLSDYPNSDTYYRLRRYGNGSFHIAPHGSGIECRGQTNTAVTPATNTWYRFRVQVEDVSDQTEVRAKIWREGIGEPSGWQANCVDTGTRRKAGTVGLWAVVSGQDTGAKYWDDLKVRPLEVVKPSEEEGTLLSEPFDASVLGTNPHNWFDTARNNGMGHEEGMFKVLDVGGQKVFGTKQTKTTNIHSHYVGGNSANWTNYEYSGRMRISGARDGIGVTFFSDYPNSDTYYRLRRYGNSSFHIAPHGSGIECRGQTNTAVTPATNTWYRFKVQVEDVSDQTEVRAKVWREGTGEPSGWQASCVDTGTRRTAGTVGLWAVVSGQDTGAKYWDDLEVRSLYTALKPTLSFSASPNALTVSGFATLTWNAKNAKDCVASGAWSGAKGTVGSETVGPFTDKRTFTLNCNGAGGKVSQTVSVTVNPLSETFRAYALGDDPINWFDTARNNSMGHEEGMFKVLDVGGQKVFGTKQTKTTNIHSHYVGGNSANWTNYEYSGRMRISGARDGIGVTFFSDYPNSDTYYRLRRYGNGSFHIAPHGSGIECRGQTNTAVTPATNTWYRFKLQVEDVSEQTEVRAKVWREGTGEPSGWQANCVDTGTRRTAGTVGLWAVVSGRDTGAKYWDDLEVKPLLTDVDGNRGSSDAAGSNEQQSSDGGSTVASAGDDDDVIPDADNAKGQDGTEGTDNSDDSDSNNVVTSYGTVTLSWTPPVTNVDGTGLTDLAGYKIYYGTTLGDYSTNIKIDNPGITSYVIENLSPNTSYYFVITAYNELGVESVYSNVASTTIN